MILVSRREISNLRYYEEQFFPTFVVEMVVTIFLLFFINFSGSEFLKKHVINKFFIFTK